MSLEAVTFGEALALFVAQEAGDLARVENFKRVLAGAEVNVAIGLTRLGHKTGWVSRVGDDPFGRFVLSELAAAGVDTSTVALDGDAPTAFQLKSRADGGDPEIFYFRSNSAGKRLAPSPAIDAYIGGARHLHVTGHPAGAVAQRAAVRRRAPWTWPARRARRSPSTRTSGRRCGTARSRWSARSTRWPCAATGCCPA